MQIFNSHEKYISSYGQIILIPFSGSFQLSPLAAHPSYPHANSRRQIFKIPPAPHYFEACDISGRVCLLNFTEHIFRISYYMSFCSGWWYFEETKVSCGESKLGFFLFQFSKLSGQVNSLARNFYYSSF